ncbi:MAG: phosphoenolpyruvate synthase, partial [Gammaproteobacteria bacterium]|nr:phosphoenolpyruvate synthase [Gammaproteobacteria bacterium]
LDPETAGVAFGMDPITGDRQATVISAVYGLGDGLVSGLMNADTYTVTKGGIKSTLAAEQKKLCLSDKQVKEIAQLTKNLGEVFAKPQDIEWAIANNQLYLLQSRAITTLVNTPDTTAQKYVWDNANIVESYAGVTTPLTFSFIQEIYTEVYKQFCRIMGVEEEVIRQNSGSFSMLGLIQGQVYYNLLNWYQVLSLLPGYSINAGFMEQMMGVSEKMEILPTVVHSKKNKYLQLLRMIRKLLTNFITLPKQTKQFYKLLNEVLHPVAGNLSPQQLKDYYNSLERSLLHRWQAPLVNDFFAMIFYGVLKKIIQKWNIDPTGTLQNDLLCGEGGIISTAPIKSLQSMANYIIKDQAIYGYFKKATDAEIVSEKKYSKLDSMIQKHIARFGDRCANELKLETTTLKHDPEIMVRLLRGYVKAGYVDLKVSAARERQTRLVAEKKIKQYFSKHLLRKMIFKFVLNKTRVLVKNRENLRFERTRLYSTIREIFLAIGKQFAAENSIETQRDIFYLTKKEIFDFIQGTAVSSDLKQLVTMRKQTFVSYEAEMPADRFVTYGVPYQANSFVASATTAIAGENQLAGTGCCQGIVRAKVRLVIDPNNAPDLTDCIMVAKRTDPGWVPLFPMAKAILVERGSLLSHSAIVAREMGIPAIVAIPNLMQILKDGDEVEMNGATGVVLLQNE